MLQKRGVKFANAALVESYKFSALESRLDIGFFCSGELLHRDFSSAVIAFRCRY